MSPDVTLLSNGPQSCQINSENLHSNVVMAEAEENAQGNKGIAHARNGNCENASFYSRYHNRASTRRCVASDVGESHANDTHRSRARSANSLASNIRHIDSVSSRASDSLQLLRGLFADRRSLQNEDDNLFSLPPLPSKHMKGGSQDAAWIHKRRVNQQRRSVGDVKSGGQSVSLSISEVSIPGIAPLQTRTRSQYELIEASMIKAGFYSVPTKPPVEPQVDENDLKLFDDADLNREAVAAIQTTPHSHNTSLHSSASVSSKTDLFAPIIMKFDDYYTPPDLASTTALSTYAIEMENKKSTSPSPTGTFDSAHGTVEDTDSWYNEGLFLKIVKSSSDEIINV